MLAISSGAATGQLLALLSAPVLSRLYPPADFGLYTVIVSLTSTVGAVAALRFELSIPLPKDPRDAHALVALGLWSTLSTAVLGTLVVAITGPSLAQKFALPLLMPWLWTVPPAAALIGVFGVLNQLAVRNRRYGAIGRRNIFSSIILVATQIGAGAAGLRPGGLILGFGFGQGAGVVSLVFGSGLRGPEARAGRTVARLRTALIRYRRFPLILAPSGLLNVLGMQAPVLLIAYYFGGDVAGWLGLSQRVLSMPVTLVGSAVAQVYLGQLATVVRDNGDRAEALFRSASQRLAVVGVAAAVAMLLLGPYAFALIFGDEWTKSGEYAQALAVGLAAQLVAAPMSQTLIAYERQFLQLGWDLGRFVLVSGATALTAIVGGTALSAIWAFSISSAFLYIASWLLSWHTVFRASRSRGGSSIPHGPARDAIQ